MTFGNIKFNLGDNCNQKFHYREVYRRIYGRTFCFTGTRQQSRKIYVRLTTRLGPTTRPIPTTGPIPQMGRQI